MRIRRWTLGFAVAGVLSLAPPGVFAQFQVDDTHVLPLEEMVETRVDKVEGWRFDARVVLGITIAVGLLGLLAGAFQSFDAKWVKPATVIAGLVVGALTLVQSTVYPTDHLQLRRAANYAGGLLDEARLVLPEAAFVRTQEDWAALVGMVKSAVDQVDQIEDQLLSGDFSRPVEQARLGSPLPFVAVAEAAEAPAPAEPAWVTNPPSAADALYFVGLGVDPSLTGARDAARADAVDQVLEIFALEAERLGVAALDADALSREILESARVESSRPAYDRTAGAWRYFTLLRLQRSAVTSAVQFFGVETRQEVPQAISRGLAATEAPPASYFAERRMTYDQLFSAGRSELSEEAWTAFEEARSLRRAGRPEEALEPLQALVAEHSAFYLGWYNLALALDDLVRYEEAEEAYLRAIALEPAQPARDASLYNTYGYLLYRMGRHQEAVEPLHKALEIAPEHPKARRTLGAVEQALRGGVSRSQTR